MKISYIFKDVIIFWMIRNSLCYLHHVFFFPLLHFNHPLSPEIMRGQKIIQQKLTEKMEQLNKFGFVVDVKLPNDPITV